MNIKQENYFVVIPFPVLTDPDLSDADKLVYGEISALANKEGYCYASNKYIAEVLSKKNRAIQYAIEKLKEKGYINVDLTIESGKNTERKIYLAHAIPPMQKNAYPHAKNEHTGMQKNAYNNISKDNNIDKLAHAQKSKTSKNVEKSVDNSLDEIVVEETNRYTGENKEVMRFTPIKKVDNQIGRAGGMQSMKDILSPTSLNGYSKATMQPVDANDPVKTAHQAYGLEAVDQLQLPGKYKARIIGSCKDMPLHRIEHAVEATVKKGLKLKNAEERANYFFAVLHNNG